MQKTKTKILTVLLLSAMVLAIIPLANASTGNILIGSVGTQTLPIPSVPAGGNITLNFGQVTFSGSQFYLLLSTDGLSQVSSGDTRYTPLFNVADVSNPTVTQVPASSAFPGQWTIGNGWVNGTIPLQIAGGTYYIKAFDGATTALAVTQGFSVTASLAVIPTSGAAGTPLTLSGNAFPSSSLVNVTYFNPVSGHFVTLQNLTQTNALGQFNLTLPAPDLLQAPTAGDSGLPLPSNPVEFQATLNSTAAPVYRTLPVYTEFQRGLMQFGRATVGAVAGNLQNATGLYGNLTSFVSTVSVGVGDGVRIVGNSFYPGSMSIKWDNSVDVTPSGLAANGTGYFNTTVTVPATGLGAHNITIVDNGLVVFAVFINVVQSITISPSSGPIGTVVTINGYGFPPLAGTNVFNATITFGASTTKIAWALTDANGAFVTTMVVPTAPGGNNLITATTNDTSLTSASKNFLVTANFVVSPTSFYANDSSLAVKASGTGFDPTKTFFVAIDNFFTPLTNTTNGIAPNANGILNFTFIGVGFQAGLHIVVVYAAGSGSGANAPAANATFTVLADNGTSTSGVLNAINSTVTANNALLQAINNTDTTIKGIVTSINGSIVTLQTSMGTVTTTLSALNATLIAINGNTATLSTSIGTINTNIQGVTTSMNSLSSTISGISGTITSISNGVATVQSTVGTINTNLNTLGTVLGAVAGQNANITTSLGTMTTTLASIDATVTSISGDTATIKTDLGTITGTITSISGDTATIKTDLGTMQTSLGTLQTTANSIQGTLGTVQSDVSNTKSTTAGLSPLIIVAIVLALIAAIAAIASIVLMRRKIAG